MRGREVLYFKSSLRFISMPVVEVKLPNGQVIGSVKKKLSVGIPTFSIKNARDETILRIEGPFNTFSFGGDVDFDVMAHLIITKLIRIWNSD